MGDRKMRTKIEYKVDFDRISLRPLDSFRTLGRNIAGSGSEMPRVLHIFPQRCPNFLLATHQIPWDNDPEAGWS
jgi:hypothetical protein